MLKVCILGSGSSGNAIFISSSKVKVLIDAGLSGKEIERRLAAIGEAMENLQAIIVSHEHKDHIHGAGILSRRYHLPLYLNKGTYDQGKNILGNIKEIQYFQTGGFFEIDDLSFETFSIPHDACDPVGFVIYNQETKVSIVTDLGYATRLVQQKIKASQLLVLESNHDEEMLKLGPYPWPTKQRIRSKMGHLSNVESSVLLRNSLHEGLKWVVLAHLSPVNNLPTIAEAAAREVMKGTSINLEIAQQEIVSSIIYV